MKVVEKKKLNKTQITIICLIVATVLLFAGYLVVYKIASSRNNGSSNNTTQLPTIQEGESLYLNRPVAYPTVEENRIVFIEVKNDSGQFRVTRYPDENGSFMLHYYTDDGEGSVPVPYVPPVYGAESDFTYESLLAVENGDGYGMIYYLTYLCSAIGMPYFTERIDLPSTDTPEGLEARNDLLKQYGLSEQNWVDFMYVDRDSQGKIVEGSEQYQKIYIGKKAASGAGYYFMIYGRNCVYYTSSEYFKYALKGFEEFVKGTLVSAGLSSDPGISGALTTDFKSWIGTMFDKESDKIFTNDSPEYSKYENPEVFITANTHISIEKGVDFVPDGETALGYKKTTNDRKSFDFELLKNHSDYERIKNILVGKNVGSYANDPILLTVLKELYSSNEKVLKFGEDGSVEYTYTISAIESVLLSDSEKLSGIVEDTDTLLKVTYRYTVDGVTTQYDCHGVIDLSTLTAEDAAKLRGLTIGTLAEKVQVRVNYTAENALSQEEKMVVTGITSIYDEQGALASVVTDKTYVIISYYTKLDGVKSDTQTKIVRLCDISDTDKDAALKTILLGKGVCDLDEVVYSDTCYYEYMRDFTTYEITDIDYFVANELVVSFKYHNASEWDPYYGGETYYKNTLTNEYKLYGLNADSCEEVVKFLSGMGSDGSSTTAVGFSGTTVAVGLTFENMEKYGLFAHKIYFELPRGLDVLEDESDIGSNSPTSDYVWKYTLGFTLYISEVDYDENGKRIRYVGSDMYNLIAKVDATNFEFLEYSFVEFWASRNILMMDIKNLESVSLEFEMSDLSGRYDFEIVMTEVYGGYYNGKYVISPEQFEGSSVIEQERVMVKAYDDAFDTSLKYYADLAGEEWYNLALVYDKIHGNGQTTFYPNSYDTLGAASFNSAYQILLLSRYHSTLTEEEKAAAQDADRVLRMHFKVTGKDAYYTYDFYRIDDRRVMVSLYRTDEDGNKIDNGMQVSDFYITSFAFKKIVGNFVAVLNGEKIDGTIGYLD